MRTTVFIACSLDGFIARQDGSVDWLPDPEEGEDFGFGEYVGDTDVLVLGRATYETVLGFPVWPYGERTVVVLTHDPDPVLERAAETVEFDRGTPEEILERLEQRGFRHAYVDGGRTVQAFLNAGCVDRLVITRVPVVLGTGLPLFGPTEREIPLRHERTRSFPNGLVQSAYTVGD